MGHVSIDLLDGGWILGGAAAYAASAARNLGRRAAVVTSAAADLNLAARLPHIQISASLAAETTAFRNTYSSEGRRIQILHNRAKTISAGDVPKPWRDAPIALLAPIAQEVPEGLANLFPRALLGVSLQGWLRRWDDAGQVGPVAWEPSRLILSRADALILSEEDLSGIEDSMMQVLKAARVAVLTRGRDGATLYRSGQPLHIPAPTVVEVDPTGAGDVFAAALLVHLREAGDPAEAVSFANRVAALSVKGSGLVSVPTEEEVEARNAF